MFGLRCFLLSLLVVRADSMGKKLSEAELAARSRLYNLDSAVLNARAERRFQEIFPKAPTGAREPRQFNEVPRSRDEMLSFLSEQPGPQDRWRQIEDTAAVSANTLDPEVATLLGIPLEARRSWLAGFAIDFVSDEIEEHYAKSFDVGGSPLFDERDYDKIRDARVEAIAEVSKTLQKGKLLDFGLDFPPGLATAPASIVIKEARNRYINDFSMPGLNDMTAQVDTDYKSTHDLVEFCVFGALTSGQDVSDCFHTWTASPFCRRLLGINDPREYDDGLVRKLVFLFAPMGYQGSPGINDGNTKAVTEATRPFVPGMHILDFVDDVRFVIEGQYAANFERAYECFYLVRRIWSKLGLVLHDWKADKLDKMTYPTVEPSWIGFTVNTVERIAHIDDDKRLKYLANLQALLWEAVNGNLPRAREFATIVGQLGFVTTLIRQGRTFLRSCYDALTRSGVVREWTKGSKRLNPHIAFSDDWYQDLEWWEELLISRPTVPIHEAGGKCFVLTPAFLINRKW